MHASTRADAAKFRGIAGTCLTIVAWLYLNIPSLKWLLQSFQQASSFNLILISLVLTVLLVQGLRYRQQLKISTTLKIRPYPLLLMLGAAISAIALQWIVNLPQLTAILFALGTYGLCGLLLAPSIWRKGLPPAILMACVLPFCVEAGTGLGFPVRVLTARVVEQLLSAWHVAAISSSDIIVLENGIAHVDLPCSGLRSLWTGTLFLLATTWLEGRQIGTRWFLVCGIGLFVQISANIVRVLILVVITYVLQQRVYAQMLHLPLGLLGFICACTITWAMLQTVPKHKDGLNSTCVQCVTNAPLTYTNVGYAALTHKTIFANLLVGKIEERIKHSTFPKWVQALLPIFLIILAQVQIYQSQQPTSIASLQLPPTIVREFIPLTAAEQRLFQDSSTAAKKYRFASGELSGSMLLVSSTSWATYHPPEMCFVGNGLKVDSIERRWLTPEIQGRWLSLQDGKLSATYWFQSPVETTDDFLSRLWNHITRHQKTWVMISVLFDNQRDFDDPEVKSFATAIHNIIHRNLNGDRS